MNDVQYIIVQSCVSDTGCSIELPSGNGAEGDMYGGLG